MSRFLPVILLLILAAACNLGTSPPTGDNAAEREAAEQVVRDFFTSLGSRDFDRLRQIVTVDFLLLESGQRWDLDRVVNMMESAPMTELVYDLTGFRTTVSGAVAYATYDNHGRFEIEGGTHERDWLESAVMKKTGGAWRLALLHSTVVGGPGSGDSP